MKRISTFFLILCTIFLLCACPGGNPVEPPATDSCPVCGKEPCECPTDETCPVCGQYPCQCNIDPQIVYGEGAAIAGAGDSIFDRSPVWENRTYDPSAAVSLHIARFFTQVSFDGGVYSSTGAVATPLSDTANKTYGGSLLTTLIFENGLEISSCDKLSFRNLIIVGDVTIKGGSNLTFENVQFNGRITVDAASSNTVFNACRFSSLTNAGNNTFAVNSFIPFSGVGIESSGNGLYVENCRMEGTGTAILSTGDEPEVRSCTLKTDKDGAGVDIRGGKNALVALSVIRGAQKSILMDGAFNTAVVKNSLISVHTVGGKNVYICDNAMGGRIFSENNNYLLADGNTHPADGLDHRASSKGNQNVNGDALTNVHARAEVGAKEDLLPHVNKDLFVGMERRKTVKEFGATEKSSAYEYIMTKAGGKDYVILAPGVYETDIRLNLTNAHSNTTVYAYGAYVEAAKQPSANYSRNHMYLDGARNVAFKGLTIGYAQQSSGQVYVVEKLGGNKVRVITGAGMENAFSNSGSPYFSTTSIYLHRNGLFLGEYPIKDAKNNADGSITVEMSDELYEVTVKGDVLTCRLSSGAHSLQINNCEGISFTDVTTYGHTGGHLFNIQKGTSATTFLRLATTSRSGEVIDETTYNKYRALETQYGVDFDISTDETDGGIRYRGSSYYVGAQDGFHGKYNTQGAQAVSCLLENICDDGANQSAHYARLSEIKDNGDGTSTIIYKASLSEYIYWYYGDQANIGGLCADFRTGDRVYIYTAEGQLVCDAIALSDGRSYDTVPSTCQKVKDQDIARYAVTVNTDKINPAALEGYDLTNDDPETTHKVLVDNMSRSSGNALFDNCLIQNGHTNGLRLKAPGGVIKHTTFRNIAKTAISLVYDIWWGESGIARDFTLERCHIDRTGYAPDAPAIESSSTDYKYCPITIMGLGGKSLDEDYLLFSDIRILNNVFTNRVLDHYNYAIYARAASNITIKGNDFGSAEDEDGLDKYASVLYLNGAANVELSGNTYSPFINGIPEMYVHGDRYKTVFGTDVGDAIKDKL